MTRFIHYPVRPKKLTSSFAKKRYAELIDRIEPADKAIASDKWIKLYQDWNELKSYISSEASRIGHEFNKNMADKKLEATEKYINEKLVPVVTEPEFILTKAFLDTKHRPALAKRFGEQLVPTYQTQIKPLDPVNTKLRVQSTKLSTKYEKILAKAQITVNGKKYNSWEARALGFSADASIRKKSYYARVRWYLNRRDKLADIYDKLVSLRTQMAKNVGYPNYIPLAYENMGRTDYSPKEIKKFRDSVKKYMAPLWHELALNQARTIGTKELKPWDQLYHPEYTLPVGSAPVDKQFCTVQKIFNQLSPRLGKHFKSMVNDDMIDLKTRPNKRTGAYCTHFSDEQKVALLCNSTGDADDIRVLTHEMGHAFQGLESMHIEAVDLQNPTYDLCEVHSMGMEFLVLPYLNDLFGKENADKFAKERWQEAIYTLCYICVVDEFQHWVYENPKSGAVARDKKWGELYDKYLPGIDFKGIEDYKKARWYMQTHIFSAPFYYIDYALAETGAMQLAMMDSSNHKMALDVYINLCRIGGTKSILKAFKEAGLLSPFDPKIIKSLADYTKKQLA
jgi:M3 family oligoendopeptidase